MTTYPSTTVSGSALTALVEVDKQGLSKVTSTGTRAGIKMQKAMWMLAAYGSEDDMVAASLKSYGYEPDARVGEIFSKYRKTHNDGVFDAYTAPIRKARSSHIVTGLPDAYGRGRIIGDYRRVALYGVDRLIKAKQEERAQIDDMWPSDEVIRMREEL